MTAERVQPTKYTLTIEFETSQTPTFGTLHPEVIDAIRALLATVDITEFTVDEVYLTSTPRWRTRA